MADNARTMSGSVHGCAGRYVFLLVCLALTGGNVWFPSSLSAAGTLVLSPQRHRYDLAPYLEVLPDIHNQWSIQDVIAPDIGRGFVPIRTGSLNLGLSAHAYWIRFSLTQPGTATPNAWLLYLNNATLESAALYELDMDSSQPRLLAERDLFTPLTSGASVYENMVFQLPGRPGQTATYFLRIDSRDSLYLPMTVVTPEAFHTGQSRTLLWYGFYYGIIVVMFVTNLIFFVRFRELSRLYYLIFVVFTALYFATRDSLTIEYLFRSRPHLDFYFGQISLGLVIIFTLLFSKEFLKTGILSRIVDHALTFLAFLSVLNIAMIPFYDRLQTYQFSTALGLTVSIALIFTGLASLRAGFRPARFYLVSFVFFLSGAIIYALNYAGVLTHPWTSFQSFQVGSALQIILLSIALSDQIAELQRQEERAQADTARALARADALNVELQEYGRTLEEKVKERTEHLKQALTKLEEMANTDALTGLFNRRKFNEVLGAALDRRQRYGGALSVVLFDIDHFKRINDTYGHQVGDAVLQALAEVVSVNIRSSDALARWGGEEFVIVAFETDLSQASFLAEKIRQIVDAHQFPEIGHMSISLGVTACGSEDTVDSLMVRVDKALYQAKSAGRNRVQVDENLSEA